MEHHSSDTGRGLEHQLRNMILTNNETGPRELSSEPGAQNTPDFPNASSATKPAKSGKKRPNQAQRRQIGSQFTIPIDVRQETPEVRRPIHQQQFRDQQGGYHPSQRRMQDTSYQAHHAGGRFEGRPQGQFNRGQAYSQGRGLYNRHGLSQQGISQSHPSTHGRNTSTQAAASHHQAGFSPDEINNQAEIINRLCHGVMVGSEIDRSEIAEKENFRLRCEQLIREVITLYEREHNQLVDFPFQSIELKCFGSLSSGFATKASDMDLALISPLSSLQPDEKGSPIPRLIEKALLAAGVGARLLTRTRVPIIKLCELPPENLYSDLLEHRAKWEQEQETGETQEVGQEAQTRNSQDGAAREEHQEMDVSPEQLESPVPRTETMFEVPSLGGGAPRKLYLRQPPNGSLQAYHATAKRVLRMAGVDDVTSANVHSLTAIDWEIINQVCKAFITGLADASLREHLRMSPVLNSGAAPDGSPVKTSLAGTFAMIEGETAIRDYYDFRHAAMITNDTLADKTIRTWAQLQQSPDYASADPLGFSKELGITLAQLRKVYSVQVATIQQLSEETPQQYGSRLERIANMIPAQRSASTQSEATGLFAQALVNRYVAGVQPREVQVLLQKDVDAASKSLRLDMVMRRHKALQLAHEFSKAVEKKGTLYGDEQARDIRTYAELLRDSVLAEQAFCTVLGTDHMPLVSRIKHLQDPHTLASNQPRQRYKDVLEFPKTGAGVQCDINFSAHLALQNTLLLRCYAACDPRVQPMVLFIKHWAKMRGINSGYKGTLSSYGYVLMVLHYLVNVAQPFVCPNLQQLAPPPPPGMSPLDLQRMYQCKGFTVHFWNNEHEIRHLASMNQLNRNEESIGHLLRGFFEYYAQNGFMSSIPGKGFDWGRDVLSLRTQGGLLSKQDKGWTGAKTVVENATPSKSADKKSDDVREVRLRYLFAIEDPFEVDHNVARTVTHNGIVSIRDEFRRAWRIIKSSGTGPFGEDLLRDAGEEEQEKGKQETLKDIMEAIHGIKFDDD